MRLVNTCGLPGETSSLLVSSASLVQECSSSSMAHELPGETSLLSVSNASVVQECCSSFSRGEYDYYWRQTLPLRGSVILAKIDVLPDGNFLAIDANRFCLPKCYSSPKVHEHPDGNITIVGVGSNSRCGSRVNASVVQYWRLVLQRMRFTRQGFRYAVDKTSSTIFANFAKLQSPEFDKPPAWIFLMFPSHGELFQHEVLFYMACPTFPSHSRRYLFVLHREGVTCSMSASLDELRKIGFSGR